MAATQTRTGGDTLRLAADRLYALAERYDTPRGSLAAREQLHDEIEAAAADVRAVVRGPVRPINPPRCIETRQDGSIRAGW